MLPTSCVGHHAGKLIESVVCCSSNPGYETIQCKLALRKLSPQCLQFDGPFIFDHNCELKHKLPTPRFGQYLTHVHSHITPASRTKQLSMAATAGVIWLYNCGVTSFSPHFYQVIEATKFTNFLALTYR